MIRDSMQLLKHLEPAVRPVSHATARSNSDASASAFESQSFDELMALVSTGQISSGRPVDCRCPVDPPLTENQLARLGAAADRAQAAGSKRAIMLIDGQGLVMNIADRAVMVQLNNTDQHRIEMEIDTAVFVASEDGTDERALSLPPAGVLPATIARQLEQAALHRMMQNDTKPASDS